MFIWAGFSAMAECTYIFTFLDWIGQKFISQWFVAFINGANLNFARGVENLFLSTTLVIHVFRFRFFPRYIAVLFNTPSSAFDFAVKLRRSIFKSQFFLFFSQSSICTVFSRRCATELLINLQKWLRPKRIQDEMGQGAFSLWRILRIGLETLSHLLTLWRQIDREGAINVAS